MASNSPTGNTEQYSANNLHDGADAESPLSPPNPRFSNLSPSTTGEVTPTGSANNSVQMLNEKAGSPQPSDAMGESTFRNEAIGAAPQAGRKKRVLLWGAIAALAAVVIAVAVAVPVVLTSRNKDDSSESSNGGSSGGNGHGGNGNNTPQGAISGGDGSEVTTEDGTTFTYVNKFGGYWVSDPADPFNNGAKANEWTPALNETWNWNTNRIFG